MICYPRFLFSSDSPHGQNFLSIKEDCKDFRGLRPRRLERSEFSSSIKPPWFMDDLTTAKTLANPMKSKMRKNPKECMVFWGFF